MGLRSVPHESSMLESLRLEPGDGVESIKPAGRPTRINMECHHVVHRKFDRTIGRAFGPGSLLSEEPIPTGSYRGTLKWTES